MATKTKTVYRKHKKTKNGVCTASDAILNKHGVLCFNCGVQIVGHNKEK